MSRTKPDPLTTRQLGLLLAATLFSGSIAAWIASLTPQTTSAVRQTQGAIDVLTERTPNDNWGFFLGTSIACLAGGSLILSRKEFFDPSTLRDDAISTILALTSHSNYLLAGGLQATAKIALTSPPAKKGKEVVLRVIPPQLKSAAEKLSGDRKWFVEWAGFRKGLGGQSWQCNFVVGLPGSGKTTVVNEIIVGFIRFSEGTGQLRIFDINYGKPDDSGRVNTWMGLPLNQIVEAQFDRIHAGINAVWDELEKRRQQAIKVASDGGKQTLNFTPLLCVIDELPALMNTAKQHEVDEEIKEKIADILTMGRGYRVKLLLISQMLAVGSVALTKAQQQQVNKLILGTSALDADIINRIPGTAQDLRGEIEPLLKQKKRACVVQFGASLPEVRVIPEIDIKAHRVRVCATDPDEVWWRETWTGETRKRVEELARSYANGEIKSPLKGEVISLFNITNMSRDERYKRFVSPVWNELVNQHKTEQKP
ncbi:hypothetical protein [Oxynema aestuarii]|uniref:FtsK domain-containing protein n=1 Tax=Oxynema aestuarii AP17 TaxID=2064643 RepID=A0A6H1U2F1_9CYAN|nr:hypothetical protein [Oxynema aestuarii]QIZ73014.1 hypothetical protein HCG48_22400 [Oxynema aestuarii AP17]